MHDSTLPGADASCLDEPPIPPRRMLHFTCLISHCWAAGKHTVKRGENSSAMPLSRDQLDAVHVPAPTLRLHSAAARAFALHADAERVVKANSRLTALQRRRKSSYNDFGGVKSEMRLDGASSSILQIPRGRWPVWFTCQFNTLGLSWQLIINTRGVKGCTGLYVTLQ